MVVTLQEKGFTLLLLYHNQSSFIRSKKENWPVTSKNTVRLILRFEKGPKIFNNMKHVISTINQYLQAKGRPISKQKIQNKTFPNSQEKRDTWWPFHDSKSLFFTNSWIYNGGYLLLQLGLVCSDKFVNLLSISEEEESGSGFNIPRGAEVLHRTKPLLN